MAKCIYPITVGRNDGMYKWKVVPCGKCIPCKRRRQAGWSFRLEQELRQSYTAAFLTLTYADEHLVYGDEYPTLVKSDLQRFMKRLRKEQDVKSNAKLVYYACGEYGGITMRPHYHMILFNLVPEMLFDGILGNIWKAGNVQVDECNIKSIQYVTKYVMKTHKSFEGREKEFSLMSKGIGKGFLTEANVNYYKTNEIPYIVWKDGQKLTMPRYYKEKIYEDEVLRKMGRDALKEVHPMTLDETKRFEITQQWNKQKLINYEKRSKV